MSHRALLSALVLGLGLAGAADLRAQDALPPLRFMVSEAWARTRPRGPRRTSPKGMAQASETMKRSGGSASWARKSAAPASPRPRTMPFGEVRRGPRGLVLAQGLMKDWQEALAGQLGRQAVTVFVPRRREDIAAAQQAADLRCLMSPEWVPAEHQARYEWPEPLMTLEQRLVGATERPRISRLEQLRGATIGTVAGYLYPRLDEGLSRGWFRRDDAPTEPAALAKQLGGRVDYTVMRELDLQWLQAQRPELKALVASPFVVTSTPVYCARIQGGSISLEALNRAQRELLRRGTLAAISRRYLP